MLSLESIIGALSEVTETAVTDGVIGFVPVLIVARFLTMREAGKDTGPGKPTSRQLGYFAGEEASFPNHLELRVRRDITYLRLV